MMPQDQNTQSSGDRLTLYFFPSPWGIDWRSPRSLTLSTLVNRTHFRHKPAHPIGHVNIEVTSETETPRRRFLVGMVARNRSVQRTLVLKERIGLGVLFHNFEGRLESPEEVEVQFEPRYRSGLISILTLIVRPEVRLRLERYIQEFKEHNGSHSYGLPNRPLHLEGSGCSAFGASFLQVAGLELPEFKQHWTRTIRVPSALIADPARERKVNLMQIMRQNRWATEQEPHRSVFFWDPDLMHQWLVRTCNSLEAGQPLFADRPYQVIKRGKAFELEVDFTHHRAPSGPIWPEGVL